MNFESFDPVDFAKKGYLHLSSFIDPTDCIRLKLRMHELVERRASQEKTEIFQAGRNQSKDEFFLESAKKISFFLDNNANKNDCNKSFFLALNKVGHALHNLCPVYKKFSHQPKFYDLVKLLGHKKPLLVQSMYIFKQAYFGDEVPPHQDSTFLFTEPDSVIGIWIALEDATRENGCLWVQEGRLPKVQTRFLKTKNNISFYPENKTRWQKEQFRPLEAKAGDIIVLHGLLPHFSEQNRSPKTRSAYTIHFIDQACYYPKTNWLDISGN